MQKQVSIIYEALVAPLADLAATLETVLPTGSGMDPEDGLRWREDLLEHLLEPDRFDRLPDSLSGSLRESLRESVATYLATLPGGRAGDPQRAAEYHAARLALWWGEAQIVEAADVAALGLEREDAGHG